MESKTVICVILQVSARGVLEIVDGNPSPSQVASRTELHTCNRTNGNVYSLLFLPTGEAAHAIVESYAHDTPTAGGKVDDQSLGGFSGDGRAAWLTLEEHFAAAKAVILAASTRLATRKLGPKEPPEIFIRDMEDDREHLRILGDPASHIRFKDLILRVLPPAYDYIRQQQQLNPQLGLKDVIPAIPVTYRDGLFRDECSPSVACPGTAMRTDAANVEYHQCGHAVRALEAVLPRKRVHN